MHNIIKNYPKPKMADYQTIRLHTIWSK